MNPRYRVRRRAGVCQGLAWAIENPKGMVVWFARSQAEAAPIAHGFAKRAALHADLNERGHHVGPTG